MGASPKEQVLALVRRMGVLRPRDLTGAGIPRVYLRRLLDDGVLDVRMITADESFARLRLLWSVLTGTVATSRIRT